MMTVFKERIRFYYVGWMVQKNSKWRIHLDNHILLCDQVQTTYLLRSGLSSTYLPGKNVDIYYFCKCTN